MIFNYTKLRNIITRFGSLPGVVVLYMVCIGGLWIDLIDIILTNTLQSNSIASLVIIITGGLSIGLSYLIGIIIKYFYYKPRPIPMDTNTIRNKINAGSMPSIHSSNAMICGLIAALSYTGLIYSIRDQTLIIAAVITLTIYGLIGYTRLALRKHFVVDVIIGGAMGICITYYVAVYLSIPSVKFIAQIIGL